jgi:hypothetical protein
MQLFGELSGVEIAHCGRLDLAGIDLRVLYRFFPGLGDQVPNGFAFFFQVAFKVGSAAAENVNWFVHENDWLMLWNLPAIRIAVIRPEEIMPLCVPRSASVDRSR